MRPVKMTVGDKEIGKAKTWAYPAGNSHGIFWIPTYNLHVEGKDASSKPQSRDFEVLRFGLHCPTASSTPAVVGLADAQTHVVKSWLPSYSVHSAPSLEMGAWQVYQSFLIHDGPDDTNAEVYATIGCIEICGAPRGFDIFNDFLIELSGPKATNRAQQLKEIGAARNLWVHYLKAKRPAATPVTP